MNRERTDAEARPAPVAAFIPRLDGPDEIQEYLRRRGAIAPGDVVHQVTAAGDGNMNRTLRVTTATTSLIVKHSPPWVEKYPDIPAPRDRALIEAAFYRSISNEAAALMPRLIDVDADARVLVLEDMADAHDLTGLYDAQPLDHAALTALLEYLALVHRTPPPPAALATLRNAEMRALNHEYIFELPLAADRALLARLDGITPGLGAVAEHVATDAAYRARAAALGREYLHGAPRALVHGDYFPGSWLWDGGRVMVIDPEFCFLGAPEFDYGVMAAHLILANQPTAHLRSIATAAATAACDQQLVAGFAGIEVMRRLLGVAQLPRLVRSLAEKSRLLHVARHLVCDDSATLTAL